MFVDLAAAAGKLGDGSFVLQQELQSNLLVLKGTRGVDIGDATGIILGIHSPNFT